MRLLYKFCFQSGKDALKGAKTYIITSSSLTYTYLAFVWVGKGKVLRKYVYIVDNI
ncbi:hypothetical protein GCM10008904_22990 [Paraclostridium ghonii]|uniref:Uncharacterized protein n=1 Tax=Paraclostridium ghonii TaxID=29358 RepID=A0ABU0N3K0_9FIRM|nr:hypothetical protein [Paeniclostridium ghonii]